MALVTVAASQRFDQSRNTMVRDSSPDALALSPMNLGRLRLLQDKAVRAWEVASQ